MFTLLSEVLRFALGRQRYEGRPRFGQNGFRGHMILQQNSGKDDRSISVYAESPIHSLGQIDTGMWLISIKNPRLELHL
jgi:hypothetical protein